MITNGTLQRQKQIGGGDFVWHSSAFGMAYVLWRRGQFIVLHFLTLLAIDLLASFRHANPAVFVHGGAFGLFRRRGRQFEANFWSDGMSDCIAEIHQTNLNVNYAESINFGLKFSVQGNAEENFRDLTQSIFLMFKNTNTSCLLPNYQSNPTPTDQIHSVPVPHWSLQSSSSLISPIPRDQSTQSPPPPLTIPQCVAVSPLFVRPHRSAALGQQQSATNKRDKEHWCRFLEPFCLFICVFSHWYRFKAKECLWGRD